MQTLMESGGDDLQAGVLLLLLLLHDGFLCTNTHHQVCASGINQGFIRIYCPRVSDPDVVDDGSSFALCSLWVSDQVVPGTEDPPAEGEVLIRGTGQTQAGVPGHSTETHGPNRT